MKKTCMNCDRFHGCLESSSKDGYHVHYFCDRWNKVLEHDLSEIFQLLTEADMLGIDVSDIYPIWDDLETGMAECYLFEEGDLDKVMDDSWYESHHQENMVKLTKLRALINAYTRE